MRAVTKGTMLTLTIPHTLLAPEGYTVASGKPVFGFDVIQDGRE